MHTPSRKSSLRVTVLSALVLLSLVASAAGAASWSSAWSPLDFLGFTEPPATTITPSSETASPLVSLLVPDTRTVCSTGADFLTMALAVADANAAVPVGGRTYLVCAGHAEVAPSGGFVITATGSSAENPVSFIKDGIGANPQFTASPVHVAGTLHDAIFEIVGADYITIDGFTMLENPANVVAVFASNTMTEWGVALSYASTTNGAQNCTIQNNSIDLDRTYSNTFGIYSNSTHSASVISTSVPATTAAGGNSGLKIYGNSITDVNNGIVVVGPTAAADQNDGIDIGGAAAATGNIVSNFGTTGTFSGYANVSGTVNGILVRNAKNATVSFNTVASSVGGVVAGTLNGIQFPAFSAAPTGTFTQNVNNNTISLQSGFATGAMNGINILGTSASVTSTINVSNNNFTNFGHTVAGTAAITFINQVGTHFAQNITGNTFTNMTVNTTANVTFITSSYTAPSGGTKNVNNNSIVTLFSKTGAGGTVTVFTDNGSDPGASNTNNFNNNNFSNITLSGATIFAGINSTNGGAPTKNVNGNTLSNITGGTSAVTGISTGFDAGPTSISGNTIANLTGGGSVTGMTHASGAGVRSISKNKIYDLSGSGTGSVVIGLTVTSTTTSSAITISNNLIGNLSASAATLDDSVRGISLGSIAPTSNFNVYYNTVYLNALVGGSNFGSTGIFHAGSSTATTSRLDLRNNIVTNTSVRNGTGATVAYRRSGAAGALANYAATSNNNLFFAGTPGPSNVIYVDTGNVAQTIAAYKGGVFTAGTIAPRDSASFTENPAFVSTTGSNTDFLHINTAIPTQIESAGAPVSGLTDDFDGNTRNVSTPDIGADEFAGVGLDLSPPTVTYTALANTASLASRTLATTITDATGVPTAGAGLPVLYWSINAGAYSPATASYIGGSTYEFTFGAGVVATDTVSYYIVAQDTAGTPNVGSTPAGGSGFSVNPPAASTPPASPSTYTIVPGINGNKTVGSGGDYATLTAAIAAVNAAEITGPVTLGLTDAAYTSPAETFPLTINSIAGASSTNTITIKPASGVTPSISGSTTGCVINLLGADHVIIDGSNGTGTTRDLTVTNTNSGSSSAVVCLQTNAADGATNNTVKNLSVVGNGSATTFAGVFSGSTTIGSSSLGTGNNTNTIQNNNISKAQYGIFTQGASAGAKNTGNVITQNLLNTASPNGLGKTGIYAGFEDGLSVSLNKIDGITSALSANDTFGISLGITGITTGTFTGNEVTNASIARNAVGSVRHTATYSACGICIPTAATGTNSIHNNMISGVSANGTVGDFSVGMFVGGGAGSTQIYNNSVSMTGTQAGGTEKSFALAIGGSNPIVDVRNNILFNTQNNGTGVNYALGLGYSTFTNLTLDNNDYFVTTTGTIHKLGGTGSSSSPTAVTAVPLVAGKDVASKSVNPQYASVTDLHISHTPLSPSPVENAGTAIAGVTTDIDGDARDASTPDMGADEVTSFQFSAATYSVAENVSGGVATITVTRTTGAATAGTITYDVAAGGTAVGGASCGGSVDYITPVSGTLSYGLGETTKTFDITVCDDSLFEGDDTINLALSVPTGGSILGVPNTAVMTITNEDTMPSVSVNSPTFGTESLVAVDQFVVSLNTASGATTTVDYTVGGGTATGGASCGGAVDYVNVTAGTLTFLAGETTKSVPMTICPDTVQEPASETVLLTLASPVRATLGTNPGTGTIQSTDAASASILDSLLIEGNTGAANMPFTVNLATTSSTDTTINYTLTSGTALAGTDFDGTGGAITILAGSTSGTISIPVNGDVDFEGDETFTVTISSPSVSTSDATATGTILNDECTAPPTEMIRWYKAQGDGNDVFGNNGTLIGAPTFPAGKVGTAFGLNGSTQRVSLGDPVDLHLQDFTIDAWVKRSDSGFVSFTPAGPTQVAAIMSYGTNGYGLSIRPDGTLGLTKVGISGVDSPGAKVTDTNYHHVAVTKVGSVVTFYVDGVAATAATPYDPIFLFGTEANIGYFSSGGGHFYGAIDELEIFNRALTNAEINGIFTAGSAGKCDLPTYSLTVNANPAAGGATTPTGTTSVSRDVPTAITASVNPGYTFVNWSSSDAGVTFANATSLTTTVKLTSGNATIQANFAADVCSTPPAGMVSWYTGETDATDIFGTNNGSVGAGVSFGPGKVGPAFQMNGGNFSRVDLPTMNLGNNYTIEMWINPAASQPGGDNHLVSFNWAGGPYGAFYLNSSFALVYYQNAAIRAATPAGAVVSGAWNHVALTYGSGDSRMRIYVNGTLAGISGGAFASSFNNPVSLGWSIVNSDTHYAGGMDEVKFYNTALSLAEVQATYNAGTAGSCKVYRTLTTASNPVAGGSVTQVPNRPSNQHLDGSTVQLTANTNASHSFTGWTGDVTNTATNPTTIIMTDDETVTANFNADVCSTPPSGMTAWYDGSGTSPVAEDIGGQNDGTMNGATFAPGRVGTGLSFDGVDDHVSIPAAPTLNPANITIDTWVKFDSLDSTVTNAPAGHQYLITKQNSRTSTFTGTYGLLKYRTGGGDKMLFCIDAADGTEVCASSTSTVTTGQWYHVAGTYDAANLKIYFNGVLEQAVAATQALDYAANPVMLGRTTLGFDGALAGQLDEVSVFNRALSQAEIAAIHTAGGAGMCHTSTLQFSSTTGTVAEGNSASFTVTRDGANDSAVSAAFVTANGTALGGATCDAGKDFIGQNVTVNFAIGQSTNPVTVSTCGDALFEADEDFGATLLNPTGSATLGTPASRTMTITANGTMPTVSVNDYTFATQSLSADGFTVSLSEPSGVQVTVPYSTADQTATGGASCTTGVDYLSTSGTLTFDPGQTTKQIPVIICTDLESEGTQTFALNLGTPTGATISDGQGIGTLRDAAASIGTPAAQLEGNSPATSTMNFPVTLAAVRSSNTVINYTINDGTATDADNDFDGGTGSITIPAGSSSSDIPVTINGDDTFEGDETFTVTITSPTIAISTGTATGTILNDECTAPPSGKVAWYPGETDADDIGGMNDGTEANGVIHTPGRVGQAFTFDGVDDVVSAPNSPSLNVTGNQLTLEAWINPTTVTGDRQIVSMASNTSVPSGRKYGLFLQGGKLGFEVRTSDGYYGNVPTLGAITAGVFTHVAGVYDGTQVSWYINGSLIGSAPLTGNIVSDPGQFKIGQFAVGGVSSFDGVVDEVGIYNRALTQSEIANIATAGGAGKCHTSTLQFSAATGTVVEGNTSTFTVTRDGANDSAVSTTFSTTDGTALGSSDATCDAGEDFIHTSGIVSFAVGQSTIPVNVSTCGDALFETDEAFTATLTAPVNGSATLGTPVSETMTITGIGPSSAAVRVGGRVMTADGRGVSNTVVNMTDAQGMRRTARTSSFGYYTFDDVASGATYVVGVSSKRYQFQPRTITVSEEVADFDLTAQPEN